jgi:hypothetical protein
VAAGSEEFIFGAVISQTDFVRLVPPDATRHLTRHPIFDEVTPDEKDRIRKSLET